MFMLLVLLSRDEKAFLGKVSLIYEESSPRASVARLTGVLSRKSKGFPGRTPFFLPNLRMEEQIMTKVHELLNPKPHPLKNKIKKAKLSYWQITKLLKDEIDEPTLSRFLNCRKPMPTELEQQIRAALGRVGGAV
jgi:hypothetical protein